MPRAEEKKPGPPKGSRPRPVTEADRQQIRDLHAEGLTRNAIAKRLGRAAGTITKVCQELGLSFDRSATAQAVAARKVDLAAQRAQLAQDLLDDTQKLRQRVWSKYTVVGFTKDGADTIEVDQPPANEVRAFYAAIGTAVTAHKTVLALDAGRDADDARSMLGDLFGALKAAVQADDGPS